MHRHGARQLRVVASGHGGRSVLRASRWRPQPRRDSPGGRRQSCRRRRSGNSRSTCPGPRSDGGIRRRDRGMSPPAHGKFRSLHRVSTFARRSSSRSTNPYRPLRAARINHPTALGDFHQTSGHQSSRRHAGGLHQCPPIFRSDVSSGLRRANRRIARAILKQLENCLLEFVIRRCRSRSTTRVGAVLHLLPVPFPLGAPLHGAPAAHARLLRPLSHRASKWSR